MQVRVEVEYSSRRLAWHEGQKPRVLREKVNRCSLDSCLTFFRYPPEQWISLRTANIIERVNKELERRTKPMEIVAGEKAC